MFDLDFVLGSTGGTLLNGPGGITFGGVSTDSRDINEGDLFIALRGENHDGHDFLDRACSGGAGACVVEKLPAPPAPDVPLIKVGSTLKALGDLAHAWRMKFPGLRLAAITGSNGKTTTKEMAASIASVKHNNLRNTGNFNNLIGLPLTLFSLDGSYDTAVVELGMNDFGEIRRLAEIAGAGVGAITNIGRAHLEKLGGVDGVARAKGELVENFGENDTFVVNADDERVLRIAEAVNCRKIFFGIDSGRATLRAENVSEDGMSGIGFDMVTQDGMVPVYIKALGAHNVMNALCAAGVASALGCGSEEIKEGLERFVPAKMRLQLLDTGRGYKIINDAYNANPESMRSAIDELVRSGKSGRTIAVLGDMLELGEASEAEHRGVGEYLSTSGVDYVIAMGNYGGALLSSLGNGTGGVRAGSHGEAAEMVRNAVRPGDTVLVKGSRGMKMEDVVTELTEDPD